MTTWRDNLRPASWRGIAFAVLGSEGLAGRRVHLHEYPFRDDPWAEDLGRRTRVITVRGFLVGDDVADQLASINDAAEQAGAGELVHPFRGTLAITLLALSTAEAWDHGRVVQLTFEFVETGARVFPTSVVDGKSEVGTAAAVLDAKAGAVAETGLLATLKSGYNGVQGVVKSVQTYVATARGLVSSATGAVRSVTGLAGSLGFGSFGRFASGSLGSGFGLSGATSLVAGVSSALSRFNSARNAVTSLATKVTTLVTRL